MSNKSDTQLKHRRIGEVAQQMLDGSTHYLLGSVELVDLRNDIGAYENDPDFMPFVAIISEVNSLSIDIMRADARTLRRNKNVEASVRWARSISLTQCESLVKRYAAR